MFFTFPTTDSPHLKYKTPSSTDYDHRYEHFKKQDLSCERSSKGGVFYSVQGDFVLGLYCPLEISASDDLEL